LNRLKHAEIALVGAGPACISAALQLLRWTGDLVVVSPHVGGCVRHARWIENLAGFPGGISGQELASRLQNQFNALQIPRLDTRVDRLEKVGADYHLHTPMGIVSARRVIAGPGTRPRQLDIPGATQAIASARLGYHIDEVPLPPGAPVLIIGGGDVACDTALSLAGSQDRVTIAVRGTRMRAHSRLQQNVAAHAKIRVVFNRPARAIHVENDGITLQCGDKTSGTSISAAAALVAIGRIPDLDFLNPRLHGAASRANGFFLVGDAAHPRHRQVAMAVGDGMAAAMAIMVPKEVNA